MAKGVHSAKTRGFTLVELMIVVVIISVLSVLAISSYRKHVYTARNAEAINFLGALRAAQESYFQAFGRYCGAPGAWAANPAAVPGRDKVSWQPVADPAWVALGLQPATTQVWFQYRFRAGQAGQAPPGDAPFLAGQVNQQPWYWIQARGDFNADAILSTFEVSSVNPTPFIVNENE